MAGRRVTGNTGEVSDRYFEAGDIPLLAEVISAITTVGTGVISAAAMATGLVLRSGSTAAYADVIDSAANIVVAVAANINNGVPMVQPGVSFRFRLFNNVAFVNTIALGAGVVAGQGTLTVASNSWKDYLVTFLSLCGAAVFNVQTVIASNQVLIAFNGLATSVPLTPGPTNPNIQVGGSISGAGIPAGTTIAGILMNGGGIYGFILSANATATATVAATTGPTVRIDSLGGGASL